MIKAKSEPQPEDLVTWADGTTCLYVELEDYLFMSDDYNIVPAEDKTPLPTIPVFKTRRVKPDFCNSDMK